MRELDRIRRELKNAAERGEPVLLATVMNVDGSVYRGAGARMLVARNGVTTGGVSGGCLEADIIARAPDMFGTPKAELVRYDTRVDDDVVLGLGLGCQGVIDILLEPLGGAALMDAIALYDWLAASREPVTLLTMVAERDDIALGTRAVVNEAGSFVRGDERLMTRTEDVARETVRPATPLVICGGGNDAIPLARLAKTMGWHVTVVDHRPSLASTDRFPDADRVACVNVSQHPAALADALTLDERTVAVSMAHSATHDRAYLHALLDAGASYVGVLGPRRRTLELLGDRPLLPNVYSPIGLDTGAETPEEIALAIVAEIAAVTAGRTGGHLRNRDGPIHERERALP